MSTSTPADRADATRDGSNKDATTASEISEGAAVRDLLAEEAMVSFAGLTPNDDRSYPDEVSPTGPYFSGATRSFKDVVQLLPKASSGELWATNDYVDPIDGVNLDAIRDVAGLDTDALESLSGRSLADIAAAADTDPIVRVRDHKDIVDDRRKALHALGYDVGFRWQIASDSYAIINPQEAYLPIVSALQRRGTTDAFGWASYRDWGGLLKMAVICPTLRHVVTTPATTDAAVAAETDGLTPAPTEIEEQDADDELVVYGGFQTGYDFRGTQTLWARPILFFPDTGTIIPDTGERYTRRHYGRATDAAHERKHDRVPINEWWRAIYDDIDHRMVHVDDAIRKTRAIAYDFDELPCTLEQCYEYWGVASKYAERAAERATAIAAPPTRPTVFNVQLSLLIAVLDDYAGSMASDRYQEYLEVAGELFRTPAIMIQLALKEHDRTTDDQDDRVLPPGQQTLSDALEDIIDIPGIDVDTEADLTDTDAQRVQDQVQQRLTDPGR